MPTERCYVPLTPEQLTRLRDERRLPGPLEATAVTPALRAAYPTADLEELEHAALQAAAQRLAEASRPVVVAAADLPVSTLAPAQGSGPLVQVGDLDLPRVAALHLGDDVVTGDPAALPPPEAGEELELSWYDTTEIAHVIDLTTALPPATAG